MRTKKGNCRYHTCFLLYIERQTEVTLKRKLCRNDVTTFRAPLNVLCRPFKFDFLLSRWRKIWLSRQPLNECAAATWIYTCFCADIFVPVTDRHFPQNVAPLLILSLHISSMSKSYHNTYPSQKYCPTCHLLCFLSFCGVCLILLCSGPLAR